jgi:hypothetical protein
MNIVVFDLETKLRPGQDCAWEEKGRMGISVGCAFSYATGDLTVHLDDNLPDLWDLVKGADLIAGYNIIEFDLPLLKATMEAYILSKPEIWKDPAPILAVMWDQYRTMLTRTYDIYLEAKAGAGVDKFAGGFKCDEVLRATWGAGAGKTGNGAMAPDLYKAGKMGELISYCAADVQRERRLFERCWSVGKLRAMGFKAGKEDFSVKAPDEILGFRFADKPPLPFRLDGDPLPTPAPTAPYIQIVPASLASDGI